jgi:hypothetical protein
MPKKKAKPSAPNEKHRLVPSQDWMRWMREKWDALDERRGAKNELYKLAQVSKAHASRLFAKEGAADKKPVSFDVLESLRLALADVFKATDSYPAFDAIESLDEWQWILVGRRLRATDPDFYSDIAAELASRAAGTEAARDAEVRINAKLQKENGKPATESHHRSITRP